MATIIVTNHMTLDGVMQAPGGADEDTRGGFAHGGWAMARMDAALGERMGQGMSSTVAMLFGRRTYEQFFRYWPKQTDGNPFTEMMNRTTKYVASTTLADPLPWENSILLPGDAADAVADLKAAVDGAIAILGSGVLTESLLRRGLVDELSLLIHPIVLGTGRRQFPEGLPDQTFELVDATPTPTGIIMTTYRKAGA